VRTMLEEEIQRFVTQYPERHGTKTTWRTPVVGFASAADPLFAQLKQIVGPTHALPGDLVPGAKTVVAYFAPFAESIVKSNIAHEESTREWADAYVDTNRRKRSSEHAVQDCCERASCQAEKQNWEV
jgi:hypothetical protein